MLARVCDPCLALQKQNFALRARHKLQTCDSRRNIKKKKMIKNIFTVLVIAGLIILGTQHQCSRIDACQRI